MLSPIATHHTFLPLKMAATSVHFCLLLILPCKSDIIAHGLLQRDHTYFVENLLHKNNCEKQNNKKFLLLFVIAQTVFVEAWIIITMHNYSHTLQADNKFVTLLVQRGMSCFISACLINMCINVHVWRDVWVLCKHNPKYVCSVLVYMYIYVCVY